MQDSSACRVVPVQDINTSVFIEQCLLIIEQCLVIDEGHGMDKGDLNDELFV